MKPLDYLLLLCGMGAVTYLPRWLPLAFLSRRKLPLWLRRWLEFIPAAILSALVAPSLFVDKGTVTLSKPDLLVAVPTLAVALWTRSLAGTVVAGMGLYWLVA